MVFLCVVKHQSAADVTRQNPPPCPAPPPPQIDPDEAEGDAGGGGGHWAAASRHPRAVLEGLLQESVSHANVVRNYRFFTRPIADGRDEEEEEDDDEGGSGDYGGDEPGTPEAAGAAAAAEAAAAEAGLVPLRHASGGSSGGTGGGGAVVPVRGGFRQRALARAPRPRLMEVWLVLEFCNRGCVADAVEKGWFRRRHSGFDPWPRAIITTAREVAEALAYLHGQVRGRCPEGRAWPAAACGRPSAGLAPGAAEAAMRG
jgi:hypothetical protein